MVFFHRDGHSVLVHGSEGTDTTLLVTTLAQLVLDPASRTFRGFLGLLEKEWVQVREHVLAWLYGPWVSLCMCRIYYRYRQRNLFLIQQLSSSPLFKMKSVNPF